MKMIFFLNCFYIIAIIAILASIKLLDKKINFNGNKETESLLFMGFSNGLLLDILFEFDAHCSAYILLCGNHFCTDISPSVPAKEDFVLQKTFREDFVLVFQTQKKRKFSSPEYHTTHLISYPNL